MLLEQMILKHKAHIKALNVKEHPEGIDFYFQTKSQANAFSDFIESVLPMRIKQSKQLVSHDQHSNIYNYKYTFMIELAPVCKDDIIIIDKGSSKELGGIGSVLLCFKVASKIHLLDPITLETHEFDSNVYWKYNFKSYIDRSCLEEYLIMSVEEEIDYKKFSKSNNTSMVIDDESSKKSDNNVSKSTNYKKNKSSQNTSGIDKKRNKFRIVNVQCINNEKLKDGEMNVITVRCRLGTQIRAGDIYYGYDMNALNVNNALEDILAKSDNIPDVVLVKKKYNRAKGKKRVWKLKHLDKDADMNPQNSKNQNNQEEQYEEFLRDVEEDKDMRKNINLYKDDEAIKELEKQFKGLQVKNENKDDSDIDIKVEELLDELTLEDKEVDIKDNLDIDFLKPVEKKKDELKNEGNLKKSQLGKRTRSGEIIDDN